MSAGILINLCVCRDCLGHTSCNVASHPPAPPRCRLERVYLVYTAEKNRGLTLRLHFMLIAAWAVGALKTVSQGLYAFSE